MGDMSKCTPCHRLFGFLFCFFKCLFASILRRLGRIHFPELRLGGPTHSGVRGALLRISFVSKLAFQGSGPPKTISLCLSSAAPPAICFVLIPAIVCTQTLSSFI